jgi:hypothetical protein
MVQVESGGGGVGEGVGGRSKGIRMLGIDASKGVFFVEEEEEEEEEDEGEGGGKAARKQQPHKISCVMWTREAVTNCNKLHHNIVTKNYCF